MTRFVPNLEKLAVLSALVALAVLGMYFAGWLPRVPAYSGSASIDPREVPRMDRPFPSAERVGSIAEAQARLKTVQLPVPVELAGGWTPREVWVASESAIEQGTEKTFIVFENEATLYIKPLREDVAVKTMESHVKNNPEALSFVDVSGVRAYGGGPRVDMAHDQPINEPGFISWWKDGVTVALLSDTMKFDELVAAAPMFVR